MMVCIPKDDTNIANKAAVFNWGGLLSFRCSISLLKKTRKIFSGRYDSFLNTLSSEMPIPGIKTIANIIRKQLPIVVNSKMSQLSGSSETYLNQTCWRTLHKSFRLPGYFRNFNWYHRQGKPHYSCSYRSVIFFHSTGPRSVELHLQEGIPRQQFQCQDFVHPKATHFLTGPTFPSAVYEFLSSRCDGNSENYVWNSGTGAIS